jgi:uncharacterized membrane protein
LDPILLATTAAEAFERFKSKDSLLVVVVSGKPFLQIPTPKLTEKIITAIIVICVMLYAYLALTGGTDESVPVPVAQTDSL